MGLRGAGGGVTSDQDCSSEPQKELGGGPGREGRVPHPGNKVLLQLLHQEIGRLLLVGLVGLQVPPGLLGAGVRHSSQGKRAGEACFTLISFADDRIPNSNIAK